MNQQNLKQAYSRQNWQTWLQDIFRSQVQLETQAENIEIDKDNIKSVQRFASVKLADGKNLAVLDIETRAGVQIARNRVGLRELVVKFIDHTRYHGILAFYHSEDAAQTGYRLSFISSEPTIDAEGNFSVESTAPKRFTYVLGEHEKTKTPADRLKIIADKHGNATLEDIKNAFSVETLTKEFYAELSNWYFWALQNVDFPNELGQDKEINNSTSVIRLITRLMFVWFLKQKKLINEKLFDTHELENILNYNDKTGSTYYKAILQNLFFATLNTEMGDKRKFVNRQSGIQGFYRYERFFKDKERFLELTKDTPFLNGGLFENLDKNVGEENEIRIDCFSNRIDKEQLLKVPDDLFFADEKQIDLNTIYDTKGKTYKVRGLIDILKSYNFTIEENTATDVEVALDPELLGKVFENLLASYNPETQTTARKQTGSFYTPREIVDYMVNESLAAYLQEKVGDDWENNPQTISALNQIKILDPACGSGAFPMGALHRMVQILQKLDPNNELWKQRQLDIAGKIEDTQAREAAIANIEEAFEENGLDYGRKLFLIENCIFGIDIQPIAVQISKLRFFISLICEQTPNPAKPNLGIRPLPNLETKFVAANTLIGLEKPKQRMLGMSEIEPLEKQLAEVRHKHFSARTPETKRKYREKDGELRTQIAEKLKEIGFNNDTAEKIAAWNPYDQNTHAEWFDAEWMFDITDGFDIVIGNPPYVEAKKLKNIASKLRKYIVATGTSDLSVYFIEKGMNLCKPRGNLYYITTNKFFNTGYGKPVRKFLLENQINKIIDFEQVEVFDNVLVSSVILGIKKTDKAIPTFTYQKFYKLKKSEFINQFVERQSAFDEYEQRLLSEKEWSFSNNTELSIKEKIEKTGIRICDLKDVAAFRGVTTGYNPAFIIDTEKKNELITADKNNEQIIKPLLQGRNIRKWVYNYNDENLIFIPWHFPLHLDNSISGVSELAEKRLQTDYPSIYNHLSEYRTALSQRNKEETGISYEWYALQRCAATYYLEFEKSEKIIWGLTADKWAFAYDDKQHYLPSNGYILTSEKISIKYLLALLNSNVLKYYFSFIGVMTAGGAYTLKQATIQQLPIVVVKNQQPLITLVNYILLLNKFGEDIQINEYVPNSHLIKLYEEVIDACVYELYFEEDFKNAGISFMQYVARDFESIEGKSESEAIVIIHSAYQKFRENDNEIRNNLKLMDIKLADLIMPIKNLK